MIRHLQKLAPGSCLGISKSSPSVVFLSHFWIPDFLSPLISPQNIVRQGRCSCEAV